MLDQDTARALLTIADERLARVALVGDRHQLPAVGRGGVLDLAVRWADPDARLTLDTVHRFADPEYAALSLTMRTGEDPGGVFDSLLARGDVSLHATELARTEALADEAALAIGTGVLVVADTCDQVAELNAAILDRLVTDGHVDDTNALVTKAGERIGAGDRVATRRNNHDLGVANRDTWTVTHVDPDGTLQLIGDHGQRALPADYTREHVEFAYASTAYGAQGETVQAAHLLLGQHTGAASTYVGMTRGRDTNTVHLVAETLADARQQWIETFRHDRADLGPGHAARLAAHEASKYAIPRPLDAALADLRAEWTREGDLIESLDRWTPYRDRLAAASLRGQRPEFGYVRKPAEQLADTEQKVSQLVDALDAARARSQKLLGEPALLAQPPGRLAAEHDAWRADRNAERARQNAARRAQQEALRREKVRMNLAYQPTQDHGRGPGIGR
jgi:exodeoxyribonuclease V alpha subunit